MLSIPELNRLQEPKKLKECRICGLYKNQNPAIDQTKASSVFWVGLSAVKFDDESQKLPLSADTRSGELIARIESLYSESISFYKTNLVKCLPLNNKTGKIRYPLKKEMSKCFPNLTYEFEEIQPRLVFLLGKQVSDFVLTEIGLSEKSTNSDFQYQSYKFGNVEFIPIHH